MITTTVAVVPAAGPVLYGFSLGLVAAVNPCGFPLLPAYLVVSTAGSLRLPFVLRALRALSAGAAMTIGFVIVFGILGATAKLGLGDALGWVPWIMVPVGAACLIAGVVAATGRHLRLRLPLPNLPRARSRAVTLVVFGVGYAVASLTCALPLFLVGVADSFAHRGVVLGLACGLAYALGMGLVVTAVSLAGTGAGQVRLTRLRAVQPVLERAAGAVLALVGGYLVLYWVTDLADPFASPAPVRAVEWTQNHLASVLTASPRLAGAVIGVMVIAVLLASGLHAARTAPSCSSATPPPSGEPSPTIGDQS